MDNQLPEVELLSSTVQGVPAPFTFSETVDISLFFDSTMNIVGIEMDTVDIALLALCPLFACIGILIASLLDAAHSPANSGLVKRFFSTAYANIANLLIGLVVGVVIALFFVGVINNDISSLARMLVLSMFLGYKAPLIGRVKGALTASSHSANTLVSAPKLKSKLLPVQQNSKSVLAKVKTGTSHVTIDESSLKQQKLKRVS